MFGAKIGNIKVGGNITRCMGKVKYNGQMVEDMKASIKMIKNTGLVHFIGLMVEVMQVNGEMVNSMVKEHVICN